MLSDLESRVARRLRDTLAGVPDGAPIPASSSFGELQSALEVWIPALLGWRYESLDAFRFAAARKVAPLEAELLGIGLLITDQTWTPLYLRFSLSEYSDAVRSVSCRLGEPGLGALGILRVPFASLNADRLLQSLPSRAHLIRWVFSADRTAPE